MIYLPTSSSLNHLDCSIHLSYCLPSCSLATIKIHEISWKSRERPNFQHPNPSYIHRCCTILLRFEVVDCGLNKQHSNYGKGVGFIYFWRPLLSRATTTQTTTTANCEKDWFPFIFYFPSCQHHQQHFTDHHSHLWEYRHHSCYRLHWILSYSSSLIEGWKKCWTMRWTTLRR